MWGIAFVLSAADPAALAAQADEVFATYAQRRPRDSAATIARIVERGEFAGRARLVVWLGRQYLTLGEVEEARRWFERGAREYAGDPWAARAKMGLGDVAMARRRFHSAEKHYRAAAEASAEDREDALIRAHRARELFRWLLVFAAAAAVLLAFFGRAARSLVAVRPRLSLPFEVKLFAPLAAVLAAMAFALPADKRQAVWIVCAGMLALFWANAVILARRPRLPVMHIVHAAAGALALLFVAIYVSDLLEPALETLRHGAE